MLLDASALLLYAFGMGKKKLHDPKKAAEHALYLAALAAGQRPPRASTIPDRRKAQSRKACRNRRLWAQ